MTQEAPAAFVAVVHPAKSECEIAALHPMDILDVVGMAVGVDRSVWNEDGEAMNGSQFAILC